MKTITLRQISLVVEADTLSHLTDEALQEYKRALFDRSLPSASARYPGELLDLTKLDELTKAIDAEIERRKA